MPTIPDSSSEAQAGPSRKVPRRLRTHLTTSVLKLGRLGRRLLWGAVFLGMALMLLAALAWGVLLYQILPRIDAWRFDLSEQATRALGVPVRIGQVQGRADGIWPILSIKEVQLLDSAGRVALRLPEVMARVSLSTLSPRALADGELRLDQLVLMSPELDIRRDAAGELHVAGLRLAGASGSDGSSVLDWVFSQAHIRIQHGVVRWTDELRHAPPLSLQQLDVTLVNHAGLGRRVHELAIEATPPAAFGQRFAMKASLTQPLFVAGGLPSQRSNQEAWWQRWELAGTRPGQWETWSGTWLMDWPQVDVQQLKQHATLPVDVEGGRGKLQAEVRIDRGSPSGFKLDVALQDVSVRLAPQLQPLSFSRLAGQVQVSHETELSTLSFQNLSFVLSEGLSWPASNGSLAWRHAPWKAGGPDTVLALTRGGDLQADRLDLALLARIMDRLPLAQNVRTTLADVAPHGVVEQLAWHWDGALEAPEHYKASGSVKGLGWASSAAGSRPGLEQANVTVTADDTGGRADLSINKGWLEFPGVFEDPRVPISSMRAKVKWRIQRHGAGALPDLAVDVTDASFANEDATGQAEGHWRTGSGRPGAHGIVEARLPGVLALTGRLDQAQATRVWRYLPLSIPKGPRDYVRLAMRSGTGEHVVFDVNGNLDAFPFKNDVGGHFRVKVPLHDVSMDYAPAALRTVQSVARTGTWPVFTGMDGLLLFEGQRMRIEKGTAKLGGIGTGTFALHDVEGRIEDLGQQDPHLTIKGQGEGPLNDLVRFLAQSPVGKLTGDFMAKAQASGTGSASLSLDIPLDHADDTRLKGNVLLVPADQAMLRLAPTIPAMTAVQGRVAFTESVLNVAARARIWGREATIDGRRSPDGNTRFVAQSVVSGDSLLLAQEFPLLQKLAPRLQGETPVSVVVNVGRADATGRAGPVEVQVSSSLQGMAALLPAPLNKTGAAAWPLKVVYRQDDAQGSGDALLLDLGNAPVTSVSSLVMPWLHVDLRRDTRSDPARVVRGTMSLQQAGMQSGSPSLSLPTKGVAAQLFVPSLDLDAWGGVLRALRPADASRSASSPGDATETYLPDSITLKTSALTLLQRTLKDVSGTLAHPSPGIWRAQIEAQQVAGQIEWLPEPLPLAGANSNAGASRVVARLSRLSIPNADAQALQDQAADQMLSTDASTTLPALDIVVDQFEWRGLPLGRLEVEAINRLVPVAGASPLPEWRMTKFRMTTPEAQLNASGNWTALGAQSATGRAGGVAKLKPRSAFGFTLDLQNSGGLLSRLGVAHTMKGGKGKLTGQVAWLGSPMEPDPLTMSGDVKVQISEGQFLKVEPGFARLLGFLSLQSIPRRLTLDFRDLLQQGFAFDGIDGDIRIAQGTATTRNLRMRGLQAVVLVEGQANISQETQNLHIYVVPDVNAGGASLAYAAINPVVGLGTFLAQVLLRKQVAEAGTQEFRITGTWSDPQVERESSKSEPAASAASAAEPGASAVTVPRKPS